MNVITVLIDSLNRHALNAYQPSQIRTPNIDAFADRAVRFDNHIVGSLPCMPARREIFTGRKEMMWRPWGPLEPYDSRLPLLLQEQGYNSAIVTDHYHYWEEAANGYLQPFQSTTLIRGHELDNWKTLESDKTLPKWVEQIENYRPGSGRRYHSNVKEFSSEDDFFPAKVFKEAAQWLKSNVDKEPFYLHVESFDVHEPFDVPEPYASMYGDSSLRNKFTLWPPYQDPEALARFNANTSPEELAFIGAQYAGKLTMVDHWFGHLLETLDEQNVWDDTVVIVTTDHGHDLGNRGVFGKQWPHFDSHANIPLWIYHPHQQVKEPITALSTTVDLFATTLEIAGITAPKTHSKSLVPLLLGNTDSVREAHIYGTFGQGVCCTDGVSSIFKSPSPENNPLFAYSCSIFDSLTVDTIHRPEAQGFFIEGIDLPQWQIPIEVTPLTSENFLFNRKDDPQQVSNLWETEPEERKRMLELMGDLIAQEGAPEEQWQRLGLPKR